METALALAPSALATAGDHAGIVRAWLETCLPAAVAVGEMSEGTLRPYRRAAARWLEYLSGREIPTPANVLEWVAGLRAAGLSMATVAAYLAAVKSLYRWTEVQGRFPNIARSVKSPRVVKDTPLPCPSREDVGGMFRSIAGDTLQGKRDRALLAVMYSTALRCVSLLRASVADVDLVAGTLRHQPKGHREKDAVAVLSTSAREALATYLAARGTLEPSAPLFASAGNRRSASGALSSRTMRSVVLSLSESVGLARRDAAGKVLSRGHWSAHSIRRAAVTVAAESLGLEAAQTLAGHASADTTRRAYARVNKYRQLQATATALDF